MAPDQTKSSKYAGIYIRQAADPRRKHNGKPDKAFEYMYRDADGKQHRLTAGWLSEGWSEKAAYDKRLAVLNEVAEEKARRKAEKEAQKKQAATNSIMCVDSTLTTFGQDAILIEDSISKVSLPTPTVDYIIEKYLQWMEGEGKHASKERNRYEVNLKPHIGNLLITSVDFDIATNLKHTLIKQMSLDSAKKYLSFLRAAYYHASHKLKIEMGRNPFSERETGFTMPKPQNIGERWLTPEEADFLLMELSKRSTLCRDMSYIMLHTGARPTEVFSICGGDIDRLGSCFWVTAKGGTRQRIMANQDCLDLLESYNRDPHEYIFQSRVGNKLKQISDTLKRTAEEIGLCAPTTMTVKGKEVTIKRTLAEKQDLRRRRIWAHVWRHTFATWLAMSGDVTLHQLRDLLRHSSIKQTERYAHYIPSLNKERSSLISEILWKTKVKLNKKKEEIGYEKKLTWLDYELAMVV